MSLDVGASMRGSYAMFDNSKFSFQQIGQKFGLTKQRIAQLAKKLGIDARQRQLERTLRRKPRLIVKNYPPGVQAVVKNIRRCGIRVLPYNTLQPSRKNLARRSQRIVLVNGLLCAIQLLPHVNTGLMDVNMLASISALELKRSSSP